MRIGDRPGRLRASALAALLALVALVWLNAAPHRHADDSSERHCPACQVLRTGGVEAPAARAVSPPRPVAVARIADVVPARVEATRLGAPPPGRSPPTALS